MKSITVYAIVCVLTCSAGNRGALAQREEILQGLSRLGPPVCVFLTQHLGSKLLDGAFDNVTGKPNIRMLQQRLAELERNAALKEELQDAIRSFRLELDERVTRAELDRRLASLTDKLVGLHQRIENLEIDRELHQVRLDDIQNDTQNAQNPAYFVDRGRIYQASADYVRAHANYSAALRVDDQYADAYVARGLAHLDVSAIEVAEIDFARAADSDPNSKDARIGKAAISMALGRFEDGIKEASAALSLQPQCFDALFIRGWCYLRTQEREAAEQDLKQCVQLRPGSAIAHNGLAVALWHDKNYAAAEQEFQKAIDLRPTPGLYLNRARMRNELASYADAVEDLNASLSHVASKPVSNSDQGLGRIACFLATPQPVTELALPYEQRGEALHHLNRMDEAVADLSKAIDMGARNGRTYAVRGASFASRGDHTEAIQDFTECLRLGVEGWEHFVFESLVANNLAVANYQDAVLYSDKYFTAKYADANNAGVHFNRFLALEHCGEGSEAYLALNAAIASNPELKTGLTCGFVKVVNRTMRTVDLCPDYWTNFDGSKTDVNNNWFFKGSEVYWRFEPGEEALLRYDGEMFRAKSFSAWLENAGTSTYSATWTWSPLPEGSAAILLEITDRMLP